MKYIATTSEKLKDIPVVKGQLIFSRDNRVIYLDSDVRTSFEQIITIPTETIRTSLVSPVEGFYFVEETSVLWRYSQATLWIRITNPPKESVVFLDNENFPEEGQVGILYVDKTSIYQWDAEMHQYIQMSGKGEIIWEELKI